VLATETHQPVYIGLSASVSGHIWTGLESVNAFLQFYFKGAKTPGTAGVSGTIQTCIGTNPWTVR
jgi:hypothetical protein